MSQFNNKLSPILTKVALGFIGAFLTLLLFTGMFISTRISQMALNDLAIHDFEVTHNLEKVLSDVSNAESSALEYSVTGQEHYLIKYRMNLSALHHDLGLLRQKVADDPIQSEQATAVESLLAEKLRWLDRLVELQLARLVGPDHVRQDDRLIQQGRAAMDTLRTAIGKMQDETSALLETRLKEMERARIQTWVWLTALTILTLSSLLWLFVVVYKETSQRLRAQQMLVTANAQLEERIQERTLELSSSKDRLQVLSRQLIHIQETERRRLAHDLHDEIGQSLTAVRLKLQDIEHTAHGTVIEQLTGECAAQLKSVLRRVQRLALDLRPALLDELGLREAVKWHARECSRRAGFTIAFEVEPQEETSWIELPEEIEIALFRVLQEALNNVLKHAKATSVTVTLKQTPESLVLKVLDNGIGFSRTESRLAAIRGESFGLVGMEERLRLLGGTLEIVSACGEGTELTATLPLKVDAPTKRTMEETSA